MGDRPGNLRVLEQGSRQALERSQARWMRAISVTVVSLLIKDDSRQVMPYQECCNGVSSQSSEYFVSVG